MDVLYHTLCQDLADSTKSHCDPVGGWFWPKLAGGRCQYLYQLPHRHWITKLHVVYVNVVSVTANCRKYIPKFLLCAKLFSPFIEMGGLTSPSYCSMWSCNLWRAHRKPHSQSLSRMALTFSELWIKWRWFWQVIDEDDIVSNLWHSTGTHSIWTQWFWIGLYVYLDKVIN